MRIFKKFAFLRDRVGYSRKLGVKIGRGCSIMGMHFPFGTEPYLVTIGDYVRINDGVRFFTHDGSVWVLRNLAGKECFPNELEDIDLFGKICIGSNVQIGSHALILPNVTIGDNVIIGAGAVVTRDIPSNSVAVGVPARVIGSIEQYYRKHSDDFMHTKNMDAAQKKNYILSKINAQDGK